LLAEGYPINFYGSESLPNDAIDPIVTLLILCAVELALDSRKRGREYKNKILTSEVNDITEKYNLIQHFLRLEAQRWRLAEPNKRSRDL
jgi:hypothetical protein